MNKTINNFYKDKTILVVGSGSVIKMPFAVILKNLGVRLIMFTWEKDWEIDFSNEIYEFRINNEKKLFSILDKIKQQTKIDGVMTFWEPDVINCAKAASYLNLPFTDIKSANIARNKSLMRQTVKNKRLMPEYYLIRSKKDLKKAFNKIGTPSVIKPTTTAGSINVVKITDKINFNEVLEIYQKTLNNKGVFKGFPGLGEQDTGLMLYEKYIPGKEFCVEGFVYKHKMNILGMIEKFDHPYEGIFFEQGDLCPPKSINKKQSMIISNAVTSIVKDFGLNNCLFHAEVKWHNGKPYFMELGARAGGGYVVEMLENACGPNLVKINLDICLGRKPTYEVFKKPRFVIAKCIIPYKNGVLKKLSFPQSPNIKGLFISYLQKVKIEEEVYVPPKAYEHIGWIVVGHDKESIAREYLNKLIQKTLCVIE